MTTETTKKERPILFSTPMVKAILEGRKTQTRRVVKDNVPIGRWEETVKHCPYGNVGDIIWVRETWCNYHTINHVRRQSGASFSEVSDGLYGYKADGFETIAEFKTHIKLMSESDFEGIEVKDDSWKPSIFMPRKACRIFLEITDIRIERLQEISEKEAMAEGVEQNVCDAEGRKRCPSSFCKEKCTGEGEWFNYRGIDFEPTYSAKESFETLWNSINDNWNENPFVWVIQFKRIEK